MQSLSWIRLDAGAAPTPLLLSSAHRSALDWLQVLEPYAVTLAVDFDGADRKLQQRAHLPVDLRP